MKKNILKYIMIVALTLALAVGLALTAYAADEPAHTHTLRIYNGDDSTIYVKCDSCSYTCDVSVFGATWHAYTGKPIEPISLEYGQEWEGAEPIISYTDNINAGDHPRTGSVYFPDLDHTMTMTFYIQPAWVTGCEITVTPEKGTFSGQRQPDPTVTVTFNGMTLVKGVDYTLDWSGCGMTDAGTYSTTLTGIGNFQQSVNLEYRIYRARFHDISFTQKNTLTYTGEPLIPVIEPSITESLGQAITYTFSATSDGPFTETVPSVTKGGVNFLYYSAKAEGHMGQKGSFSVLVNKADNQWTTTPAIEGWIYGETAKTPVAEAKFGDYTVTYTGTMNGDRPYDSTKTPTEAGEYTAIFTVEENDSHTGLTAEVPFTIRRATLTPADFTYTEPDNLVYDGQVHGITLKHSLSGVLTRDITIHYSAEPKNAGDYTFRVDIPETRNYLAVQGLTASGWKFTVQKADPVISWDATGFTYDGAEHGAAKVTLVNGETYSGDITYTSAKDGHTSGKLPVDAGTYTVTASIAEQPNYNAAEETISITIEPKKVTPTAAVDSDCFTYDGNDQKPTVEVTVDGNVLPAGGNYTVTYTDNKEVGVATATITRTGGNYTFEPMELEFLILPDMKVLNGIDTTNVTSGSWDFITDTLEQMDDADIRKVSKDTREKWKDIIDRLTELDERLEYVAGVIGTLTEDTAALGEHATTDKLDEIGALEELYNRIRNNLTEAQKQNLADEVEKLATEKEHIRKTLETLAALIADVDAVTEKDLTYKDKEDIKGLRARLEEAAKDPHLSEEDEAALKNASDKLAEIEALIEEAEKVEALIDKLPKTGEPDDKDLRKGYKEVKKAYDKLPNKDLVNPKAVAKLEKLAKALRDYKIIKGGNQWWYTNDEEPGNLTLTANGPYSKFDYIKIDGQIIDEKHYTSKEGSTIVTLKESFLETLSYARHTISIGFTDGELSGEATGHFRVTLHLDSPATGDTTNLVLFGVLGLSSLLALAALTVIRKKRGA